VNSKKHLAADVQRDRREGISLADLSKKYKLAKSTVSAWCKEVYISEKAARLIKEKWLKNTNAARAKGTLKNKQKRIDSVEMELKKAQDVVGTMNSRDLLVLGIGLYWAEGSKKENGSGFSFINSDHLMIKLMCEWLTKIMHVKKEQMILNVCINISHKQREVEILKFWSNLLDLPVGHFGNTIFIRTLHRKIYDNPKSYFGMLRIRVRSSSWLRRRILGMIKVCVEHLPM
jgi:hypothetical protein